jgi:hypothetical protein
VDGGRDVPEDVREALQGDWSMLINPGVFTWVSDRHATRRLPWGLDLLDRLACPSPEATHPLDSGTTLAVRNYYPHTEEDPHAPLGLVPRPIPPGAEEASGLTPALRCTLTSGSATRDFAVAMFRGAVRIRLGGALYLVRYRPAERSVGFTLTLKRAWQARDPGSDRPAWFQSDVELADEHGPREHCVSMNRPLSHGPYKVFQANYRRLTDPATGEPLLDDGRPVSLSGLAVAHDPGLWLKYAGALAVVAGIATMFWMRGRPRQFSPGAT